MIDELNDDNLKILGSYNIDYSHQSCPLGHENCENHELFNRKNLELLDDAYNSWQSLESVRRERRRNLRYKNGDQWSDYIEDPDMKGRRIKEEHYLLREGRTPLKHNFLQQFVRNITGYMLNNQSQSVVVARTKDDTDINELLTNTLQAALYTNGVKKLSMTLLEELMLCGISCIKVRYDYFDSRSISDAKIDLVNLNRLFFNTDFEDPRFEDLRFIGEIHDYTLDEVISIFSESEHQTQKLKDIFSAVGDYNDTFYGVSTDKMEALTFYNSTQGKCRVFEIWERTGRWVNTVHDYADGSFGTTTKSAEDIAKINNERLKRGRKLSLKSENIPLVRFHKKYEHYWKVSFLASDGTVLREMETPYNHRQHPYIINVMPVVDGNFKGIISDLIDIQRYINRLIVMQDFIIGSSAKGVLMVPESSIPDGMSASDFADEYVKIDGVIVYKPSATGERPYQVTRNSTDVGAWRMIEIQMQLLNEISGLSGAMQGQKAPTSTPSSLYSMQVSASLVNHQSLFTVISDGECARDEKLLKVILQFYNEPRYIPCYSDSDKTPLLYRPSIAENIDTFNLVVSQQYNSVVYRQIYDDILLMMLNSNQIPLDIYLRNSSMPFANRILMQLNEKENEKNSEEMDKIAELLQHGK